MTIVRRSLSAQKTGYGEINLARILHIPILSATNRLFMSRRLLFKRFRLRRALLAQAGAIN